ncbi:MAG: hypothetical protein H7096_05395 [Flavobacterium sp.]|nr:hypothetical protein [Pedobacter sp.]
MKKIFYGLLILCIVSLGGVYLFIPAQIIVSKAERVESSERIITQYVSNYQYRNRWWPEKYKVAEQDTQTNNLKGFLYKFSTGNLNYKSILIKKGNFQNQSLLNWQIVSKNTYEISWRMVIKASNNPLERFLQYQKARLIKNNMDLIFEKLLSYVVSSKNIYGYDIKRSMVKDTILATYTITSPIFPETKKVYDLIGIVKKFADKNEVKQVNKPMLNVSQISESEYQATVAIPINKDVVTKSEVKIRKMIPGNILELTVTGGPRHIENGFKQLRLYINDFQLTSPAMPFELLITDRVQQPDTSKWVTKIYYPIF